MREFFKQLWITITVWLGALKMFFRGNKFAMATGAGSILFLVAHVLLDTILLVSAVVAASSVL